MAKYRILITGSRHFRDDNLRLKRKADKVMHEALRTAFEYLSCKPEDCIIVHGDCAGADKLAAICARELGVPFDQIEAHPADWAKGKSAGPERNQKMVDLGADVCLAFPMGDSKGTYDCMFRAFRAHIPTITYPCEGD